MAENSSMPLQRTSPTVHPTVLLTAKLNSPCTAVTAAASPFGDDPHNRNLCYIIYGKANGETIVASDDQCIQQSIPTESECAISVIVCGDGRDIDEAEIFVIAADGQMRVFSFPRCLERGVPRSFQAGECQFEQLLNANICFAEILDFDYDGKNELLVAMTDRVVRSYRYEEVDDDEMHFVPLNKWEVPSHISGISVGYDTDLTVLLSQVHHQKYVRINWATQCRVVQPMSAEESTKNTHQLILPPKPIRVSLFSSIATKVFVANTTCNSEILLKVDKSPITGAAATILGNKLQILITVDSKGFTFVYGWMDHLIPNTDPMARCRIPRNPDRLCALADPGNPNVVLLGVSYLGNKLTFLKFNLENSLIKANLAIDQQ
ncbi:hypothetical protein QR680_019224 [Steinernema hermaphroditum]|uniref:Uncharacterized protein n=1 Tax=Steinernema hermaphroditum TaxID=289476 RepID=A0AA39HKD8_9BILA|nr:hypothetical protein QR680_019224 [Steinernema hermaphroditum]